MNGTYPKKKEKVLASAKSKERLGLVDKTKSNAQYVVGRVYAHEHKPPLAARLLFTFL